MLHFNFKRLFELRGIDKPYTFLVQNGFVPQTASNWANNSVGYVKPSQLEKLCLILNCTPNDLFDWRDDGNTVVPEGHALRTLTKQTNDIQTTLRELPLNKLEKLGEMLAELKAGEDAGDKID